MMKNPLTILKKRDYLLWGCSLAVVAGSFLLVPGAGTLSLIASLIGVSALIFLAKGHILSQILTLLFSALYGLISWKFRYYGELLTYLGMTFPMALVSLITWLRNPDGDSGAVAIRKKLSPRLITALLLSAAAVTALFGWLLARLHTPNLFFSIVSITTSYLAAFLTACRSPLYALAYAANDVVLIILWVLAARADASFAPMIACFSMFLLNDCYGYISWKKRAQKGK